MLLIVPAKAQEPDGSARPHPPSPSPRLVSESEEDEIDLKTGSL